MHPTLSIYLLT